MLVVLTHEFNTFGINPAKKLTQTTDKLHQYGLDWRTFEKTLGGIVRLKRSLIDLTDP